MPTFEQVPLQDAIMNTATGKRAEIVREYLEFIDQLGQGQAGKLRPAEGETVSAVRRRLGAAAKVAGKDLVIKRAGDEVYFWVSEARKGQRRRGRPRKAASE